MTRRQRIGVVLFPLILFVCIVIFFGAFSSDSAMLPVVLWPQVSAPISEVSSLPVDQEKTLLMHYRHEEERYSLHFEKEDKSEEDSWALTLLESSLPITYSASFNGEDLVHVDLRFSQFEKEVYEEELFQTLMPGSHQQTPIVWNESLKYLSKMPLSIGSMLITTAGEVMQIQLSPQLEKKKPQNSGNQHHTETPLHASLLQTLDSAGAEVLFIREHESLNKSFIMPKSKKHSC